MTRPTHPAETTQLSPLDELRFRAWVHNHDITDLDAPKSHYDYRGAFVAGAKPDATGHWPDTFKQHGHPTFSTESQYSNGPGDGGNWHGDTFIPQVNAGRDATSALPTSRRPKLTHEEIASSIARQEQLARVHNWSTPTRALAAGLTLAKLTGIPDIMDALVHPKSASGEAERNLADIRKRGVFAKWNDLFKAIPAAAKHFGEDLANRDPRAVMSLAQLAPVAPAALERLIPEIGLSAADRAAGRALMHTPPIEQSAAAPGYLDAHMERLNIARRIGQTSPAAEESFNKLLTRRTVRELHDQALGPAGGATIDPATGAPTRATGFAVADPKFTLDLSGAEDPRARTHAWLERPEVKARLEQPGAHMGSWRNPKTGAIEINISDIVPDQQTAVQLGHARGQEAVGQLNRGQYVGDVPVTHPDAANIMPHQTLDYRNNPLTPAIKTPSGKIVLGQNHGFAEEEALRHNLEPGGGANDFNGYGFVDKRGQFLSRDAAIPAAKATGAELYAPDLGVTSEDLPDLVTSKPDPITAALPTVVPPTPKPAAPMPGRVVYHGTTNPGFDVPTRSNDLGPHVGTSGQADEILRGDFYSPPGSGGLAGTWRPNGSRIIPLQDLTSKPFLFKEDTGWGDPKAFAAQMVKQGSISKDEAAGLTSFGKIKQWLLDQGYDRIDYKNKVEASKWVGGKRRLATSSVILNPEKHLVPALGGPQSLAFEEGAHPPANLPDYIGAKMSRTDISGLGDALAHHLAAGDDPGTWLQSVQNSNPLLGTMLRADPGLADKVFKSASQHTDFVKHMRPYEEIAKIAERGGPQWDQWYGPYIKALREAGVPEDVAQRVLRTSSILSTRKAPTDEVLTALRTWQAHETGQPITNAITQHTNDLTKAAIGAIQGEPWATRPGMAPRLRQKTSNYLLSELTGGQGVSPTLDTWHAKAYLGENLPKYLDARGNLKLTPAQWRVMQGRTISDAGRSLLPTGDFQARVWGGENGYIPAFGQSGANRADWLSSHLASGDFDPLIEKYPGLQGLAERGAIQGEAVSPEAQRLAQLGLWQQLSQGQGPLKNLGGLR